ncbi:MAG: PspA-associated protein PspAB [Methanosarcina sp.]|uniref:PspA-associated protein PspAB n=1 Tax=Methanosarcina sp. TaxID=2213 RepID=UPI003BB7F5C2
MGFQDFMDAVLGRNRLPKAKSEKLFAISTAVITLDANLGLKPSGAAGICFKPIGASAYESARKEIQELLEYSSRETETEFRLEKDEYNFLWAIFKDPDFEDLVANIHLVSQTLEEHSFGQQILCAIYRFDSQPEAGTTAGTIGLKGKTDGKKAVYWIYNFKQGTYYPFIPLSGGQRDSPFEFRLRTEMEREMPIEKNVEKWYPLWGIPF